MKKSIEKYSLLIKQILAVHYSGCYITNKELKEISSKLDIDIDLADREAMLKRLIALAAERNRINEVFLEISKILKNRFQIYSKLANDYEECASEIREWMQKCKSIDLLIKQRARINPYEKE